MSRMLRLTSEQSLQLDRIQSSTYTRNLIRSPFEIIEAFRASNDGRKGFQAAQVSPRDTAGTIETPFCLETIAEPNETRTATSTCRYWPGWPGSRVRSASPSRRHHLSKGRAAIRSKRFPSVVPILGGRARDSVDVCVCCLSPVYGQL